VAAVTSVTPSSNTYIDALLGNYKWASGSLTYSFPTSSTYYESGYGSNEPLSNFEGLNATQQGAVRAAFANFAAVANVTFSELTGANAANATLRLAMSDAPSTAWAYMPHTSPEGGDSWYNNSDGYYDSPRKGNYANTTFLHEIGHALGLEHPHENGMPVGGDSMEFSVMSYRAYVGAPLTGYTNESWGYAQSLMMYDIAAMQHLYGANFSSNSGNTTYSWSPTTGQAFINGVGQGTPGGNRIFQTVWDGGGTDTYDFSNYTTDLNVDLRPGQWTTASTTQLARLHYSGSQIADGNIANALQYNGDVRSLIENAIGGSGHDTLIGNAAVNLLHGGRGNDIIWGEGGEDTAVFSGLKADYAFEAITRGVRITDSVSGRDGIDIVYDVENFVFSDLTVSLATLTQPNGSIFAASQLGTAEYGHSRGWTDFETNARMLADINGDERADIIGLAYSGTFVSLSNGDGTFGQLMLATSEFGGSTGWGDFNTNARMLADVNGDNQADMVGFAYSGTIVALSNGNGTFAPLKLGSSEFSGSSGWGDFQSNARTLADVNGDGRADLVGFAYSGTIVALSSGDGTFAPLMLGSSDFGGSRGWGDFNTNARMLADVNGDGCADVVGFAYSGTIVALSNGDGTFSSLRLGTNEFGGSKGWGSADVNPRMLADVNGDGLADIIGFAEGGIYVSLSNGDGTFSACKLATSEYGGLSSFGRNPRDADDINGDGMADIFVFGDDGGYYSLAIAPAPSAADLLL
jgi:serralysin